MRHGESSNHQPKLRPSRSRFFGQCFHSIIVAAISIALAASANAQANQQEGSSGPDLSKYMPLLEELGRLQEKMQREIQSPALRTQPKLLAQLPASTEIYFALPNYGDSLHQAVQIFHQELQDNQTLREGWQSFPMGSMVEDALDKVYQLSQFLGNEIVISGEIKPKGGSFVIVAEVKKPGLTAFLQGQLKQLGGAAGAPIRILSPQQLLTAKTTSSKQQALALVRPDLVVITSEMSTLKGFNTQLARPSGKLAPTAFGQRLAQAYQGGVGILFGANLEHMKGMVPTNTTKDAASFQQTGFADVKYLIAERKEVAGETSNGAELSFSGPRHGVASWLAAPAPLGSLDFVSANAALATSLAIKSPAQMFDDILAIAKISNPDVETGLAQGEAAVNLKLKDDLLNKIGKDITLSLDGPMDSINSMPPWKVIIQVRDAAGLQQTLKQLLATASGFMQGAQQPTLDENKEAGQTFYTLRFSSGSKPTELNYAFADGYMVVAANHELLADALRLHHNGTSLARSSGFQALRPQDHPGDASAVVYQNFAPLLAPIIRQMSPDQAPVLQSVIGQAKPSATFAYGEENAIRVASNSRGADAFMVGLIAAIAIPNLMKSRQDAHGVTGASTVRTIITSQITYANSFPKTGYASDLASLGSGPDGKCGDGATKNHACLMDSVLGCDAGASGGWCIKNGYRFATTAVCKQGTCDDFVIVGTPVDPSNGKKSFCATSDAVPRSKTGPPLIAPISVSECQSWEPL